MRYLMLVYGNEEIWSDPAIDFAALVADVDAFNNELQRSGELLASEGLIERPHAVRAGRSPEVTDGPYLEAKEFVGSYTLLDVADEARALEIAASYPALRHTERGGVEVWPLMERGTEA